MSVCEACAEMSTRNPFSAPAPNVCRDAMVFARYTSSTQGPQLTCLPTNTNCSLAPSREHNTCHFRSIAGHAFREGEPSARMITPESRWRSRCRETQLRNLPTAEVVKQCEPLLCRTGDQSPPPPCLALAVPKSDPKPSQRSNTANVTAALGLRYVCLQDRLGLGGGLHDSLKRTRTSVCRSHTSRDAIPSDLSSRLSGRKASIWAGVPFPGRGNRGWMNSLAIS